MSDLRLRLHLPRRSALLGALAAAFVLSGMTFHHGWSNYHQDFPMTLTGVITKNDIGNPHTYIDLRITERSFPDAERAAPYAEIEEWNVVLAPLTRMQNRGMSDTAVLNVGETVTIVGYPHRSVVAETRAERIIIGDMTIELR